MAKYFDGTKEWEVPMDQTEAEKIVHRDLPDCILAGLAPLMVSPSADFQRQVFEGMEAATASGILDGTIRLNGEGRLVFQLLGLSAWPQTVQN